MSSNVIKAFPAHSRMTVEQALREAQSIPLAEVLVIGVDQDGQLFVRSGSEDGAGISDRDAVWMLEAAKLWAFRN